MVKFLVTCPELHLNARSNDGIPALGYLMTQLAFLETLGPEMTGGNGVDNVDILKVLVTRDDLDINGTFPLCPSFMENMPNPPKTVLMHCFESFPLNDDLLREVIEILATSPHLAPTLEEIDKASKMGIRVVPCLARRLNKWRTAVSIFKITNYWWKVAGEGQYCPDGMGRKRDREKFEAEFA